MATVQALLLAVFTVITIAQDMSLSAVLSNECEVRNADKTLYTACGTEAQQLFQSGTVAKNVKVIPENSTCGNPAASYCRLGVSNADCVEICNVSAPSLTHSPDMAIDGSLSTWWQSVSWLTYPRPLDVTFHVSLNKQYQLLDDVVITFDSARPRDMVLERSVDGGSSWSVWQYYAKDCEDTFAMPAMEGGDDPQAVLCLQSYSNLLPYRHGQIVFDVLSRYKIYLGAELNNVSNLYQSYSDTSWQRFLQFTDIRLRLLHPSTDGEEVNGGFNLQKYYYGISDILVTAECSCHLHASTCHPVDGQTVCDCKHNTAGVNCEYCLPLYNNRQWMAGSYLPIGAGTANECQKCECNGHSDVCSYNSSLSHGVCINCMDNTTGYFCHQCLDGFYSNTALLLNSTDICQECQCDVRGTIGGDIRCDEKGRCNCKANVRGDKCSHCQQNFYRLQDGGNCHPCGCSKFGVVPSSVCDDVSGQCECKNTTVGRTCSQCGDNFYRFPSTFEQECLACDCVLGASLNATCHPLTGQCHCLPGTTGRTCDTVIDGYFLPSPLTEYTEQTTSCSLLYIDQSSNSEQFTGNHVISCVGGQNIVYSVNVTHHTRVTERSYLLGVRYRAQDNTTLQISVDSRCFENNVQLFNLSLSDSAEWTVAISNLSVLLAEDCSYLVTLTPMSQTVVDSLIVAVDWSQLDIYSELSAHPLELCYLGTDNGKESICRRLIHSGMAEVYGEAVECGCDKRGTAFNSTCEAYGGQCRCLAGVKGRSCDQCFAGLYQGPSGACQACLCGVGAEHAVCDADTGQCSCHQLVAREGELDFYGNPSDTRCGVCTYGSYNFSTNGCTSCNCHEVGSEMEQCHRLTGECECKSGVAGDKCNQCKPGFYAFSQSGCRSCDCDIQGSLSSSCDLLTGQCSCKENVEGMKCDQCSSGTFGLSEGNMVGCSPCYCSNHSHGQCLPAQGYFQTRVEYEELSDNDSLTFDTLLPSYGHMLEMYILSEDGLQVNSTVVSIGLADDTHAVYKLQHSLAAGVRTGVNIPLIENYWQVSTGAPIDRLTFQYILAEFPTLYFIPTLHYTAVSVTIATSKQEVMSSEARVGVENCTCSPASNTEGVNCQRCKDGYRRANMTLGTLSPCVPCQCNGRTEGPPQCHPLTGTCINCRLGTTGDSCESCDQHVIGAECAVCEEGYWGLETLGSCTSCSCDLIGSVNATCDQWTGSCYCKKNVIGQKCGSCSLNHHNLSSDGCSVCHDCYSLVGDKVEDLLTSTSNLTAIYSAAVAALPCETNLTLTENVHLITSQLSALTTELMELSNQKSSMMSTLNHLRFLAGNVTFTHLLADVQQWNVSLNQLNHSLVEYSFLGVWLQSKIDNDSAQLEDIVVELANLSLSSHEEKLSALGLLLTLSANMTSRLQQDVDQLSQLYISIETTHSIINNMIDNLTLAVQRIQSVQRGITTNISMIEYNSQLIHNISIDMNNSLNEIDQLIISTNQSLSALLNVQPMRDKITELAKIDNLTARVDVLGHLAMSEMIRLSNYSNSTEGRWDVIGLFYNQSQLLSQSVHNHLLEVEAVQEEITSAVNFIDFNRQYVSELELLTRQLQTGINATGGHLKVSLDKLQSVRDETTQLAADVGGLLNFTRRAQWQANGAYINSIDLYNRSLAQLKLSKEVNTTAFQLKTRAGNLPTGEYLTLINKVLEDTVALHNDSCLQSTIDLDVIKNRFATVKQEVASQSNLTGDIQSQRYNVEYLLAEMESVDVQLVSDISRQVEMVTDIERSLDVAIDSMTRKVAEQKAKITAAELRLEKIQHDLDLL